MNAAERAPYLDAGDAVLMPLGFKRKKKEFAWRRPAGSDVEWIHLNFGLGVINPSYGVSYADLNALFPPGLGVTCGPSGLLQSLTGTSYSSSKTPPNKVAGDFSAAISQFPKLRDRAAFAEVLMSETPPRTLVNFFSDRIRALPLLLISLGRTQEAFEWLARFEAVAPERDQIQPPYHVYAAHFRRHYASQDAS